MNSIDAMSGIHEDGPRELLIKSSTESDNVLIQVWDSGPGLESDESELIFEPFFTTKPQGLGLGLSISRSIIEAHGGRLWVAALPALGADFRFSLPVTRNGNE
jgi:signal transduction histidine kinase